MSPLTDEGAIFVSPETAAELICLLRWLSGPQTCKDMLCALKWIEKNTAQRGGGQ